MFLVRPITHGQGSPTPGSSSSPQRLERCRAWEILLAGRIWTFLKTHTRFCWAVLTSEFMGLEMRTGSVYAAWLEEDSSAL
jgi:hypothetical protein